jgi:hypothetical protein
MRDKVGSRNGYELVEIPAGEKERILHHVGRIAFGLQIPRQTFLG